MKKNIRNLMKPSGASVFVCSVMILTASFFSTLYADGDSTEGDLDIFTQVNVPANVLFLVDTSTSMVDKEKYCPSGWLCGDPMVFSEYDNAVDYTPYRINPWSRYRIYDRDRDYLDVTDQIKCQAAKNIVLGKAGYLNDTRTILAYNGSGTCKRKRYECCDGVQTWCLGACSQTVRLYSGNYLNWRYSQEQLGLKDAKINIARRIIQKLILNTSGVRFGVMRFNAESEKNGSQRGARLVAPIGADVKDIIFKLQHDTQFMFYQTSTDPFCTTNTSEYANPPQNCTAWSNFKYTDTPVAEALADAGLYLANKPRYGEKITNANPVTAWCQKNYIILISDGTPESDYGYLGNSKGALWSSAYINSRRINESEFGGSSNLIGASYLPNIAKLLNTVDLQPSFPDKPSNEKITARTFVIGFGKNTPNISDAEPLLNKTATNGSYTENKGKAIEAYYGSDGLEIEEQIWQIIKDIKEESASFVAPVVPASKTNDLYSSNSMYVAYFKPSTFGEWKGNLKKFGINDDGQILQKDGTAIHNSDGTLKNNITSAWSSGNDYSDVTAGGAASMLAAKGWSNRNIYTNVGNELQRFSTSSALPLGLTPADFGAATIDEALDINRFIRGDLEYSNKTPLADIIHSRPSVLADGTKNIIFVGSNDGYLHCLIDDEKTVGNKDTSGKLDLSDDTVDEAWSFIPRSRLPSIRSIVPRYRTTNAHYYFIDGESRIFPSSSGSFPTDLNLIFGMRRGGTDYHVLKIGQIGSDGKYVSGGYSYPTYKFNINDVWLSENNYSGEVSLEPLGKSWSRPYSGRIMINRASTIDALIISGGYDWETQDYISDPYTTDAPEGFYNAPGNFRDTRGKAIYVIDTNGKLQKSWKNLIASIPDFVAFDSDWDGITDTIYAGSTRGTLYGITDRFNKGSWPENPSAVFKYAYGQIKSANRSQNFFKIFYAPDVVLCKDIAGNKYDYVFWGTGDREHPDSNLTKNRFYGLKVRWNNSNTIPYELVNDDINPESDIGMINVTNYSSTSFDATKDVLFNNVNNKGWFIVLNGDGEKVVSSPKVYDGVVYFTTYVPYIQDDICSTDYRLGQGRLYAIRYDTGEAAYYKSGGRWVRKIVKDDSHNQEHRWIDTGVGMPTEIQFVSSPKTLSIVAGTGKDAFSIVVDDDVSRKFKQFYWRQR